MQQPKPKAEAGMTCPMMRKDVSKVCHRCEFYQVLRGKSVVKRYEGDEGEWIEKWACTIAHQHMLINNQAKQTHDQTVELNVLRNEIAKANASSAGLVARLGMAVDALVAAIATAQNEKGQLTHSYSPPNVVIEDSRDIRS